MLVRTGCGQAFTASLDSAPSSATFSVQWHPSQKRNWCRPVGSTFQPEGTMGLGGHRLRLGHLRLLRLGFDLTHRLGPLLATGAAPVELQRLRLRLSSATCSDSGSGWAMTSSNFSDLGQAGPLLGPIGTGQGQRVADGPGAAAGAEEGAADLEVLALARSRARLSAGSALPGRAGHLSEAGEPVRSRRRPVLWPAGGPLPGWSASRLGRPRLAVFRRRVLGRLGPLPATAPVPPWAGPGRRTGQTDHGRSRSRMR